jgi:hypothetical protein
MHNQMKVSLISDFFLRPHVSKLVKIKKIKVIIKKYIYISSSMIKKCVRIL